MATRAWWMSIGGILSLCAAAGAEPGILGRPAPRWNVEHWLNLPATRTGLDVGDYRGKVVYLYCFQSWCPGCHRHGFPTLRKMIETYRGNENVAFVAVQTVFEGFDSNTLDHARRTAEKYELTIPIGHSGRRGKPSALMRAYRTGGTPWTILIDRQGIVRFNGFHIDPPEARRRIDALLARPTSRPAPTRDAGARIPRSRGGQDVIGKRLDLVGLRWLNTKERKPLSTRDKVTLVRWWTDGCPHCTGSLPAIQKLSAAYEAKGFQAVAVYHPKRFPPLSDGAVLRTANQMGYAGPVAVDDGWALLKRFYLEAGQRSATSVSFLLDKDGVVRFVHPGPEFRPTDEPAERRLDGDYRDLRRAISVLLAE